MKELIKAPEFWIVVVLLIFLIFRWVRLKKLEEKYIDPATIKELPSWLKWGQW